ncbi:MAG: septum formation initiator family protein [Kiritimatiellae bacterium]|nr:septum formation initiator family protein [Kiritimatiellia bacterium]
MKGLALITRILLTALLVLALVGIVLLFTPMVNNYRSLRREEAEWMERVQKTEEELKALKQKQEQFKTDPRFVEVIAHDLGLAKTNEVLIKLEAAEPAPGAASPPETSPR